MEKGDILSRIPDTSKVGWQIQTQDWEGNRGELEAGTILKSKHAKLGVEVSYGQGPDGYDQWVIREPNGGGSVIVPYVEIDGEVYIGAIRQKRSLTKGWITEVSRGFTLPTESHLEAAKREFQEETGVTLSIAERVEPLPGKPVNPNSSYFQANPRKGEGVKLFGVRIDPSEVEERRKSADPRRRVYRFSQKLQGEIKEINEKIKPEGIRFFHSSLLRETSDGFTLQAIARITN